MIPVKLQTPVSEQWTRILGPN